MTEKELLRQWLGKKEYLSVFDIPKLDELGNKAFHNVGFLYEAYEALAKEDAAGDTEIAISHNDGVCRLTRKDDGVWTLSAFDKEITLAFEDMKDVLIGMIDLQEEIYPLGSVVALNKDFMARNIPEIGKLDSFRVVITHRFMSYADSIYYPYAGVIYPFGMLGRPEVLYFSYAMVDEVMHKGFADESEDAYVYEMKKELILERGMHSVGFATKEELEKIEMKIRSSEDE